MPPLQMARYWQIPQGKYHWGLRSGMTAAPVRVRLFVYFVTRPFSQVTQRGAH